MSESKKIFSPIRNERVSYLVEEKIKQAIFENHFTEGDKIPSERELADMFGVSRLSVREAMRSLERSGLLVIKKGVTGGGYVLKSDATPVVESLKDMLHLGQVNLEDIAQARLAIEPTVCSLAAQKASPEDIERLEEINRMLGKAFHSGDPFRENDPKIHSVIAEISGNQVFAIIVKALMEIHAYRMQSIKLDKNAKRDILEYHGEIIEAIKSKDEKMAFEYMKRHIIHVQEALMNLEKKSSRKSSKGSKSSRLQ